MWTQHNPLMPASGFVSLLFCANSGKCRNAAHFCWIHFLWHHQDFIVEACIGHWRISFTVQNTEWKNAKKKNKTKQTVQVVIMGLQGI